MPGVWSQIDLTSAELSGANRTLPALDSIGGRALVMVLSHDCQLDKETTRAARKVMRENPEMSLEQAFEVAADDITLDRFAIVAPIVLVDLIPNNGEASFTNSIVNGTSIGYFPLADNPQIAINRMVVDLSYRSTVDILTLSERLASLSDTERLRLRYALAKMDTLRVPKIDANFTEAIGQKITDIRVGNKATNTVHFILDNGKTLEVLLPAAPVDLSGPVRKKPRTAHA